LCHIYEYGYQQIVLENFLRYRVQLREDEG